MRRAWLALGLAACGAGGNDVVRGDASTNSDAASSCGVSIAIDPAAPVAGDHVHATAIATGVVGVPSYAWTVDGAASTAYEAPDDSAIGFDVPTATPHTITVDIGGTTSTCAQGQLMFDVIDPTGATALYRLRVVPPAGVAPPYEATFVVHGGTNAIRDVPLDPGEELAGTVTSGAMPVPAYLTFTPTLGAAFDAFSAITGALDVRVALQPYQVLVVPELSGLAPRLVAWTPGTTVFDVDAGQLVTGTVLAPGGGPLANAQVQLASGGVPSTLATTGADGTFAVHAAISPGAQVAVGVVPPAASGLARLAATAAFDLSQPLQIAYASAPATCDLSTDTVKRGGVAQSGARVTVVGALAGSVGTVTAGVAASATGTVLVAATTTGAGAVPSTLVPRSAALSAIVEVAPGDLAVAALDTSACAAQTIDAPAQVAATGVVRASSAPIGGVHVEATPTATLALATLVPVEATTAADGTFALALASGGYYDLRISDPSGRGAPQLIGGVAANAVPSTIALGAALAIGGTVSVNGGASTVPGAAVELLCSSCTGVAAERPIAQSASDVEGHYQLTVPDPGSM